MEIKVKQSNEEYFIIVFKSGKIVRCDLSLRQVDVINMRLNFRLLNMEEYENVTSDEDKDRLMKGLHDLLAWFTIDPREVIRVQASIKNPRYAVIETANKKIQIDREFLGLRDEEMFYMKTGFDNEKQIKQELMKETIKSYQSILKELNRLATIPKQISMFS